MKVRGKDYFWNSIAGIINAAEAVVMSMIVMRYGQLSDAGILSLAFAVFLLLWKAILNLPPMDEFHLMDTEFQKHKLRFPQDCNRRFTPWQV